MKKVILLFLAFLASSRGFSLGNQAAKEKRGAGGESERHKGELAGEWDSLRERRRMAEEDEAPAEDSYSCFPWLFNPGKKQSKHFDQVCC